MSPVKACSVVALLMARLSTSGRQCCCRVGRCWLRASTSWRADAPSRAVPCTWAPGHLDTSLRLHFHGTRIPVGEAEKSIMAPGSVRMHVQLCNGCRLLAALHLSLRCSSAPVHPRLGQPRDPLPIAAPSHSSCTFSGCCSLAMGHRR